MLSHVDTLIYIAKRLVVVVDNLTSSQGHSQFLMPGDEAIVNPLSRLVKVQSEVLHLLECLLGLSIMPIPNV